MQSACIPTLLDLGLLNEHKSRPRIPFILLVLFFSLFNISIILICNKHVEWTNAKDRHTHSSSTTQKKMKRTLILSCPIRYLLWFVVDSERKAIISNSSCLLYSTHTNSKERISFIILYISFTYIVCPYFIHTLLNYIIIIVIMIASPS